MHRKEEGTVTSISPVPITPGVAIPTIISTVQQQPQACL